MTHVGAYTVRCAQFVGQSPKRCIIDFNHRSTFPAQQVMMSLCYVGPPRETIPKFDPHRQVVRFKRLQRAVHGGRIHRRISCQYLFPNILDAGMSMPFPQDLKHRHSRSCGVQSSFAEDGFEPVNALF
jgi:hypothetical protein